MLQTHGCLSVPAMCGCLRTALTSPLTSLAAAWIHTASFFSRWTTEGFAELGMPADTVQRDYPRAGITLIDLLPRVTHHFSSKSKAAYPPAVPSQSSKYACQSLLRCLEGSHSACCARSCCHARCLGSSKTLYIIVRISACLAGLLHLVCRLCMQQHNAVQVAQRKTSMFVAPACLYDGNIGFEDAGGLVSPRAD